MDSHPPQPAQTPPTPPADARQEARKQGGDHSGLGEAVRATSLVTLLSRFFGMIRDVLLVQIFGATAVGSAFSAAFLIPNLFRRLFGEGALSAAFVPEYAVAEKRDPGAADRLASYTMVRLAIITTILMVVVELGLLITLPLLPAGTANLSMPRFSTADPAPPQTILKWHIKPGQTVEPGDVIADVRVGEESVEWRATQPLTVGEIIHPINQRVSPGAGVVLSQDYMRHMSIKLMMIMFPFMPAICMAAILAAMLQVHGRFGPSMTGPFFLNAFITAVGVYFLLTRKHGGPMTAYTLSAITVLSGFAQLVWFRRLLRPYVRWTWSYEDAKAVGKRMLGRFIPVMVGLGGLQLSSFLDLAILMWPIWVGPTILGLTYPLDVKSNIILRSTQLLYSFPLGVFGVAVATAIFPMLSRAADQPALFLDTLRRGLRLSLFIGLPASVGLVLIREDITHVLFQISDKRGFSADDVQRSADVLLGYAPAVWAYSLNHVLTRAFYAKHDTVTPMRISVAMVAVNFVMNATLIWLPEFQLGPWTVAPLRESALAWATSLCATAQTIILLEIAKHRFCPPRQPIMDRPTIRAIGRVVMAVVVMGAVVGLTKQAWNLAPDAPYWQVLARLLACTAAGGLVYVGEAIFSRSPEYAWLTIRQRTPRGETNLSVD